MAGAEGGRFAIWWRRCRADPECRARVFQWLVYASLLYTAAGFVVIILMAGGYLEFHSP